MGVARRAAALALAILLAAALLASAEIAECPQVETCLKEINKYGNLKLAISGDALLSLGYAYGDVVTADIGGNAIDVPLCQDYNDVDAGAAVLRVTPSDSGGKNEVSLAICSGDLATWLGIAEETAIEEEPGFRWDFAEPYADGVAVVLTLKEKGGYLEQIALHQLQMSNLREDYPELTDAQYANFRDVATTGMGANALYRAASPVNPKYNRSREADDAVRAAGIRTVMNMSDSEATMKGYADYASTCYSGLDVIPLNMMMDFETGDFQSALAEGFRFLADREGPFLIHCTLGKDRTGFACAILECLMGASEDEVVADYMASYYNFYGVEPGTEAYATLADSNIRKTLAKTFGVESLSNIDLAASAEAWLQKIGMTGEEISALKAKLGADIE